jgi:hypothetical protein
MNQFVCTTASEEVRARLLLGTLYPECKTTMVSHAQIQAQLDHNKALHLLPSTTSIDEFVKICGLKEGTEKRVLPTFFSNLKSSKRKALAPSRKVSAKKKQSNIQKIVKNIETIVISSDSEDDSEGKQIPLTEEELEKILAEVDHTSNKYPERNYIDELLMMDRPIDSETEEW